MIAAVPHIPSDYSNPEEVMIVFYYFVPARGGHPIELQPEFVRHKGECEVELAMPNVDPDDIEIHYRDRQVFVAGKLLSRDTSVLDWMEARSDEGNYYAAMTLPREYDRDNVGADYDGEILRITLHQKDTFRESKRVIHV